MTAGGALVATMLSLGVVLAGCSVEGGSGGSSGLNSEPQQDVHGHWADKPGQEVRVTFSEKKDEPAKIELPPGGLPEAPPLPAVGGP